jgi:hypothetical protein
MKLIRKHRSTPHVWKSELLAQIRQPRCWICAQLIKELDLDFCWFVNEHYYEIGMIDKMRLAHGFCPIHTRYFLEANAHSVNISVYSYLTWYVLTRLNAGRDVLMNGDSRKDPTDLCREAAKILHPASNCPMCESLQQSEAIAVNELVSGLADVEIQEAYRGSGGLCVPHFRQAAFKASWNVLRTMTDALRARLDATISSERSDKRLLEQTVGLDRDRAVRHHNGNRTDRIHLTDKAGPGMFKPGEPPDQWSPTFDMMLFDISEPGCSVCRACEEGVRSYLGWLAHEMETKAPSSKIWDLSWYVCPSHLWDLAADGHQHAATVIAEHMIHEWLARLQGLAQDLGERPADAWFERLGQSALAFLARQDSAATSWQPWRRLHEAAAVLESAENKLDRLREAVFRSNGCQACRHVEETTRRKLDLILRILEDPRGRKVYRNASGVCLRHCVAAADVARVPEAFAELLSAQIARLRMLEWELDESSRKNNWSVRYETNGPESDIWRRAACQFCGV